MRALFLVSAMSLASCGGAPATMQTPVPNMVAIDPPSANPPPESEAPKDVGPVLELGAVAKLDGEPLCPKDVICRQHTESALILPLIAKLKDAAELENRPTVLVDPTLSYAARYDKNADPSEVSLGDVIVTLGNQNARGFTLGATNNTRRWKVALSGLDLEAPSFRLTNQHTTHVSRGGTEFDATCTHPATGKVVIDVGNLKTCLDAMASQKPWTTINFYPQPEQKMSELFAIFAMLPADSSISIAP